MIIYITYAHLAKESSMFLSEISLSLCCWAVDTGESLCMASISYTCFWRLKYLHTYVHNIYTSCVMQHHKNPSVQRPLVPLNLQGVPLSHQHLHVLRCQAGMGHHLLVSITHLSLKFSAAALGKGGRRPESSSDTVTLSLSKSTMTALSTCDTCKAE